jgi:hypothetical protein
MPLVARRVRSWAKYLAWCGVRLPSAELQFIFDAIGHSSYLVLLIRQINLSQSPVTRITLASL